MNGLSLQNLQEVTLGFDVGDFVSGPEIIALARIAPSLKIFHVNNGRDGEGTPSGDLTDHHMELALQHLPHLVEISISQFESALTEDFALSLGRYCP